MKFSKFQLIVLAIFVIGIIAGVVAFATYKAKSSSSSLAAITVWGTYPKAEFDQYVISVNNTLSTQMSITYVQETAATFLSDFTSALARGKGPDAILVTADMLLPQEDKLLPIPYTALSQRAFLDTYIGEASAYLAPSGILGIPFSVDPLVMYWNRDMFNASGVASYPQYWDQFSGLVKSIGQKGANGSITKSAVALGDFSNVDNAREILGSLIMQFGNPVTVQYADGTVASELKTSATSDPSPAVQFFAHFVDPNDADYSWNRSWPDSKSAFLAGNLATYFGFASELPDIRAKNPNLDFDVAPLPQARSGGKAAAYGRLFGFSIVRATPNANSAFQIISTLTQPQYLATLSATTYLPAVDLAVIQSGTTDPYLTIFDREALISKTWLDADPTVSNQIFGSMVDAVTSGQKSLIEAVNDAGAQYDNVLQQATQQ